MGGNITIRVAPATPWHGLKIGAERVRKVGL